MNIEITDKDKTRVIWILTTLLVISLLFNISDNGEKNKPDRLLHYGMVDENVNYQIIVDQETESRVVYPELLSDDDTLYIDGYAYVKKDSNLVRDKKSVIYLDKPK